MNDTLRELLALSASDVDYSTKLQTIVESTLPYKVTLRNESEFNYFMSVIIGNGGRTCSLWWECLEAILPDKDYSRIRDNCYYGDKPLLTLEVEKTKIVGFNLERLVVRGIKYQPTNCVLVELGKVSAYDAGLLLVEVLPTLVGDLFKVIVNKFGTTISVRLATNGNVHGYSRVFDHERTLEGIQCLKDADILVKDTDYCINKLNRILFILNVLIYKANCWLDEQKEIAV